MGYWHFEELSLHDDQVERFIAMAAEPYVRDGNVSDWEFGMRDLAKYIADRMVDSIPELAATGKETE